MTIVNLAELVNAMGKPELEDFQEQHIESIILPSVQQWLEDYCNRPLELTQVRERIQPDETGWVELKVSPVSNVISVVDVNGEAVNYTRPAVPAFTPPTDPNMPYRDYAGGPGWTDTTYKLWFPPLNSYGLYFGAPPYYYVTYVAGLDCSSDAKVKDGIIQVAKRQADAFFGRDVGVRQGVLEQAPVRDSRPPEWTPDELTQFDRYRRRVIA